MRVIQIEEKRFKELFDAAFVELLAEKYGNYNHYSSSEAGYKSALIGMHKRFVYIMRQLQDKLEEA